MTQIMSQSGFVLSRTMAQPGPALSMLDGFPPSDGQITGQMAFAAPIIWPRALTEF